MSAEWFITTAPLGLIIRTLFSRLIGFYIYILNKVQPDFRGSDGAGCLQHLAGGSAGAAAPGLEHPSRSVSMATAGHRSNKL